MKIAIYEPESMLGGLLTWALHLKTGLVRLGHEAEIITFTRSGKPYAAWTRPTGGLKRRPSPYDRVYKYADAAGAVNSYDGIILNNPVSYLHDRAAQRGTSAIDPYMPDYLSVLRRSVGTPVTVAVHCSTYSEKDTPYLAHLRGLPALTSTVVDHSGPGSGTVRALCPDWTPIAVPLPYEPRTGPGSDDWDPRGRHACVGITGRYTAVKGHRALAAAKAYGYLPDLDVELWGAADVSVGPSATLNTYEQLRATGLPGFRNEGSRSAAMPWYVNVRHAQDLTYAGGYLDSRSVMQHLDVHVNLTTTAASGGALEYSQLESMDAGCIQVSPSHRWDEKYAGAVITGVDHWPSDLKFRENRNDSIILEMIGEAVTSLYGHTTTGWTLMRRHNREQLRSVHDPENVARAYVSALMDWEWN